jgi:hypothetical protein
MDTQTELFDLDADTDREEVEDHIEGWEGWMPKAGSLCRVVTQVVPRLNPLLNFWGEGQHRDGVITGGHAVLMHEVQEAESRIWSRKSPAWVARLLPPIDGNWLNGEITQEVQWALSHFGFAYQDLFHKDNDGMVLLRPIDMWPADDDRETIEDHEAIQRGRFFSHFGDISEWSQVADLYNSRGKKRKTRELIRS